MKVHLVSETEFVTKGQGVHTAFLEIIDLLKEKKDVDVVVNGRGTGDVFHAHTYGPYYFWKGRKYKGKRIHTVHVIPDSIRGSLPLWKYLMPLARWYFRIVYSYADVCIAISPMVEEAIRGLGAKTEIVRITNPICLEHWKRTEEKRKKGRKMLGLSDHDFVILGAGQLEGRKGVEDFLDIATAIPEAKFVWAGGRPFGIFTEGIKRLNARIAHAPKHIKFTGLLDLSIMPEVYAAADLLLFTSYQENCPLVPLEAAASGIPVIYRDIREYNLLYEHPYLMAGNTEEFVEMTKRMVHDFSFYKQGVNISEKLITQFDKNKIREKLMHLYERLSHKPRIIHFDKIIKRKESKPFSFAG